jgi:hypothetical protein
MRLGLEMRVVDEVTAVQAAGAVSWSRPELRNWAELYAELTGRGAIAPGCEDAPPPEVVAIAPADITSTWLRGQAPTLPQGLLVLGPEDDPLTGLIGAKIARCRQPPASAVMLDPGRGRAFLRPVQAASFEQTTAAAALPALPAERGILVLATHSDGVDALLAPGELTLCPREGWSRRGSDSAPPCARLRRCHRHELSFEDNRLVERTLDPRALRAFVLVLAACNALRVEPERHDAGGAYGWSLMASLLRARVGSVTVLGVGLHLDLADGHRALVAELLAGTGVGRAVAEENRRNPEGRMVLIGDPAVSFPPGPGSAEAAPPPACEVGVSAAGARFLAAYLAEAVDAAASPDQITAAASAHSLAAALAMEVDRQLPSPAVVEYLHARILPALGEFLRLRGTMIALDWSRLRAVSHDDGEEPCAWCGTACARRRYRFANAGLAQRYLVACPCCGIVRDSWLRRPRPVERLQSAWKIPRRHSGTRQRDAAVAHGVWGEQRRAIVRRGRSTQTHHLLEAARPQPRSDHELVATRAAGIYVEGGCLEIAALPAAHRAALIA